MNKFLLSTLVFMLPITQQVFSMPTVPLVIQTTPPASISGQQSLEFLNAIKSLRQADANFTQNLNLEELIKFIKKHTYAIEHISDQQYILLKEHLTKNTDTDLYNIFQSLGNSIKESTQVFKNRAVDETKEIHGLTAQEYWKNYTELEEKHMYVATNKLKEILGRRPCCYFKTSILKNIRSTIANQNINRAINETFNVHGLSYKEYRLKFEVLEKKYNDIVTHNIADHIIKQAINKTRKIHGKDYQTYLDNYDAFEREYNLIVTNKIIKIIKKLPYKGWLKAKLLEFINNDLSWLLSESSYLVYEMLRG